MEIILSSAKRGYGLKELLSENESEYWATNDALPHFIVIRLPSRTYVYSVSLNLSFISDESYTPEQVTIHTPRKTHRFKWIEPVGFKDMKLNEILDEITVVIESNHADGRDSHVRGLRIFVSPGVEYGQEDINVR